MTDISNTNQQGSTPNFGGLDPSFFAPANATPEPTHATTPDVPAATPAADTSVPSVPEGFDEFDTKLRTYYGIGGAELKAVVEHYQTQQREQHVGKLREAWGDNFETTFGEVEQRFKSLPPDKQALLNNAEGALLIAQVLQYEKSLKGSVPDATPPSLDGTTATPGGVSKYRFTRSQLMKFSAKEYAEKEGEISAAFREGLVDMNS